VPPREGARTLAVRGVLANGTRTPSDRSGSSRRCRWSLPALPQESARATAPACAARWPWGRAAHGVHEAECGEEEKDNGERKVHLLHEDFTRWGDVVSIDEF
jgi:hypothetical protein